MRPHRGLLLVKLCWDLGAAFKSWWVLVLVYRFCYNNDWWDIAFIIRTSSRYTLFHKKVVFVINWNFRTIEGRKEKYRFLIQGQFLMRRTRLLSTSPQKALPEENVGPHNWISVG